MLMKLYMQDFVGDAFQEVPYEDKKFIKMMNEETVKIGRHYQTPLTTGDWQKADLLV